MTVQIKTLIETTPSVETTLFNPSWTIVSNIRLSLEVLLYVYRRVSSVFFFAAHASHAVIVDASIFTVASPTT